MDYGWLQVQLNSFSPSCHPTLTHIVFLFRPKYVAFHFISFHFHVRRRILNDIQSFFISAIKAFSVSFTTCCHLCNRTIVRVNCHKSSASFRLLVKHTAISSNTIILAVWVSEWLCERALYKSYKFPKKGGRIPFKKKECHYYCRFDFCFWNSV